MAQQIGPFKIEDKISKGGMGSVYKAQFFKDDDYPGRNGRYVALKITHAHGPHADTLETLLRKGLNLHFREIWADI